MRRILYGDIVTAASVIRRVKPEMRGSLLAKLMEKAHCADKFRKRNGRWCPGLGDGSLVSACSGLPRENIDRFGDADVVECMREVFDAIGKWKLSQRLQGGNEIALPGIRARKTEC